MDTFLKHTKEGTIALEILAHLQASGAKAYIVGGCVRDYFLKRSISDIDIACNLPWEQSSSILADTGFKIIKTGTKFSCITAIKEGLSFEISSFRVDGVYGNHRSPSSVHLCQDIETDLMRRDFTMNAIAYNPKESFIDPFGGVDDINNSLIRAVGLADDRFKEDALRILRALRFAAQTGFIIERSTEEAIFKNHTLLEYVSQERKASELTKTIVSPNFSAVFRKYHKVLDTCINGIAVLVNYPQNSIYHNLDLLEHTLKVVEHVKNDKVLKWAALLHDIGKPSVRELDEQNFAHYPNHCEAGRILARDALTKLKFSKKDIADICILIQYHDLFYTIGPINGQRLLKLFRGDLILAEKLILLMKADANAKSELGQQSLKEICDLEKSLKRASDNNLPFALEHLKIDGNDLKANTAICDRQFSLVLDELLDAVIDGKVENNNSDLLEFAKTVL